MTVKSIRKCDEKVRAQQLGVKEGDKFVVLSPEDSYNGQTHNRRGCVGNVLILKRDDLSSCPRFFNVQTGDEYYEHFSCLARYEEKDISLRNVKFDMKAIAEELDVPLEKAHYIVQTALFERGVEWGNGSIVQYPLALYLFSTGEYLSWGERDCEPTYKQLSIKPQYSFYEKEGKPETIEFNGKMYSKEDVAKALALLSSS